MRRLALGIIGVLAALPLRAQDIGRGQRLAEQWCANCHAVERRGSDAVPTMQDIANLPERDAEFLRGFLVNPHPPMPPFAIARDDIDDLVAYIISLRQR